MFEKPEEKPICVDTMGDNIGEEESGTVINEIGGFEKMELFPLKPEIQDLIRGYFEKKGFEIMEITDTYVKVKSPSGRKMTIENKVAEMYIGKNI